MNILNLRVDISGFRVLYCVGLGISLDFYSMTLMKFLTVGVFCHLTVCLMSGFERVLGAMYAWKSPCFGFKYSASQCNGCSLSLLLLVESREVLRRSKWDTSRDWGFSTVVRFKLALIFMLLKF